MSETTPITSEATVIIALREALPQVRATGQPTPIPKGFACESWRVATDTGELVVKLRRQMTDAAKLRSQAEATRLARAAGVPAPEILYAGLSATLNGHPLMILRYLPGTDAEEALPHLDNSQRTAFFADFGDAIGRLHSISLPQFTERIGSPEATVGDWATVIHRAADRYSAWNRRVGVLESAEIDAIRARLIREAETITAEVRPTLTHRDLYLANVLVNNGRFAALLDFEVAKGHDPLVDFIKLGTHIFESWPESFDPFMAAYRRQNARLPHATERLQLCLALDQFVSVPNWVHYRAEQLLRDSCQRLRDWLTGIYPWWIERIGAALDAS